MSLVDDVRVHYQQPQGLFVAGKQVPAASGATLEIVNPATSEPLARVAAAQAQDVDLAVAAAREAFERDDWRGLAPSKREQLLWRIAELLQEHADELGVIESLNNGKTLSEGRGDAGAAADCFRYYAGSVRRLRGETMDVDAPSLVYTLREPIGVCGQIVPWNYPLLMASWKVAPALACGCCVLLKPSEWTPLTALRLADLCKQAGVPDGVVNVLPGDGPVAGEAIARHMGVDKLAFTGSVATARSLLKASAESNLKKLSLELGGKSPLVVFPDADLDAAAKAAFWGIFANKGEVCSASSRLLAHRDIKEQLVDRLAKMATTMRVGDPLDPGTEMGAIANSKQYDKIIRYLELGKQQGARVAAGGQALGGKGLFVQPTVFDDVTPDMTVASEEIFGPVLSVLGFQHEEQALEIANASMYGLVAAVFTKDVSRAHRVARGLQAGVVWINRWNGFDCAAPFGGVKYSGWGRELGEHAIDLYTQTKCVWVA
ncbi:MAG: aldehyde dehydrogenase family protein [Proteobacteria bacterium]|nr:aldehyde dehydrogenase family protein [Pseudomonadota bacterium]